MTLPTGTKIHYFLPPLKYKKTNLIRPFSLSYFLDFEGKLSVVEAHEEVLHTMYCSSPSIFDLKAFIANLN